MTLHDPKCMRCYQPKSSHEADDTVGLVCPPVTGYFTPCEHKTSRGWGQISSDGYDGETWCDGCGEQLTFRRSALTQPAPHE